MRTPGSSECSRLRSWRRRLLLGLPGRVYATGSFAQAAASHFVLLRLLRNASRAAAAAGEQYNSS